MGSETQALLSVRGVGKAFAGLQALSEVDLDLSEGEILGIIGPNGAGKTTLFNVIAGAIAADEGSVTYRGEELLGLAPHAIARRGLVRTFQLMRPFDTLSVFDNVRVAAFVRDELVGEPRQEPYEIIESVGLAQWAHRPAAELPTAGRKRLELARSLALEPSVLLLDEVLAGLAPTERAPLLRLLSSIRDSGVAMLFVEHVMAAVMALSDRVLVLHHGRMLATGSPAEVTSDARVIEAYLGETELLAADVAPSAPGRPNGRNVPADGIAPRKRDPVVRERHDNKGEQDEHPPRP